MEKLKEEVDATLIYFTCGPQKPWFQGPNPFAPFSQPQHITTSTYLAHCGLFWESLSWFFVLFVFTLSLAQQGKLLFLLYVYGSFFLGTTLSRLIALKGLISHEKERQNFPEFPPTLTNTPTIVYTDVYTVVSFLGTQETLDVHTEHWLRMKSRGFSTKTCHSPTPTPLAVFLPLRPTSMDPTDSLQSALEPRGSSLPLEPVSEKFGTDSHSAPCPGRPTNRIPFFALLGLPLLLFWKGSLYRNALFMIVIINYCYDYLIKDLYHTEEGTKKCLWFRNCQKSVPCFPEYKSHHSISSCSKKMHNKEGKSYLSGTGV